jgi:uncharacterized membrane protein
MRVLPLARALMAHPVPPVVYIHLFSALAALVLGTVQLARAKGTGSHRVAGWTWAGLMLTAAFSSLWMPAFLHLGWIHVFTLVTLVSLPIGLWQIRTGQVAKHAGTMRGLYIGGLVIAGAFTLTPGRLLGDLVWKGCWNC